MSTMTVRYLQEAFAIKVCGDCLCVLANGLSDDPDGSLHEAAARQAEMHELEEDWSITLGHLDRQCADCSDGRDEYPDRDCTTEFSSAPCESCGQRLAGRRHPATLWVGAVRY